MTQSNPNSLNTMFSQIQPMNLNLSKPKICEKHQKPVSFYNKYKPEKDPVCFDCLAEEAKELNPPNLYLPYNNLEQDYYFQKSSLLQIIEQANNIKKYERHISNFQQLLTRYFSQFIAKFIKDKIYSNVNKNLKVYEFLEKSNIQTTSSSQEIMTILSKFENQKFILENKCADVFCQINKLQKIFLKNHKRMEEGFKNLLSQCFEESDGYNMDSNEKVKENRNDTYLYKTQSNKKNPDIMNCVNIENDYYSQSNISAPCKNNANDFMTSSPQINMKSPKNENINKYSSNDKINKNIINTNSINPTNININMEKARIFEESPINKCEPNDINQNPKKELSPNSCSKSNLPISPKIKNQNESPELQKKRENDNLIYRDHKEKINNLIEKDKNKKANQSFYQPKKSKINKKSKLNSSFRKTFNNNHSHKYGAKKNVQYRKYNNFIQEKCNICGASFTVLENNSREDNICLNCRNTIDENEGRSNNKRFRNKRDLGYKRENSDFKYSHHPTNFVPQKKRFIHSSSSSNFWNKGKINFINPKKDSSFNNSYHYSQKNLPHKPYNSSNFISRQINNNNRMNSPKPFRNTKNYGFNPNPKFRNNKDYHHDKGKSSKDNFGIKKYNEKNLNDDFEVELNSVEESKNNESETESEEIKEKSFSKTTRNNDFFKNNFEEDKSDNFNDNENNFNDFDDNNKNDMNDMDDANYNEEIKENDNSQDDDNAELDVDF